MTVLTPAWSTDGLLSASSPRSDRSFGVGEQTISLRQNLAEIMPLSRSNLAFAACKEQENLPLVLGALVRLDADHDGCRPPTLRNDEGLLGSAHPPQSRGGILPKIGHRDDVEDLGPRRPFLSTPKSTSRHRQAMLRSLQGASDQCG
jgi:hypothetical protein